MRALKYAALIAIVLLAGCRYQVKTRSFGVQAVPGANDNTPVEVEFVSVRNDELLATLLAMTSQDWFAKREQLKSDYPKELRSVSWEFVPGQRVAARDVGLRRHGAKALIIFANYSSPGPHRLRADPFKRITLLLSETDFSIQESN